jgi:hypothetical protein
MKKIVSDPGKVAEIINKYFVNVAVDIGKDQEMETYDRHRSVLRIVEENKDPNLTFVHTSEETVGEVIRKLGIKKATGTDKIPAKVIKAAEPVIALYYVK